MPRPYEAIWQWMRWLASGGKLSGGGGQMASPFPGMDPYLEDPTLWRGVHHYLIAIIAETLGDALADGITKKSSSNVRNY